MTAIKQWQKPCLITQERMQSLLNQPFHLLGNLSSLAPQKAEGLQQGQKKIQLWHRSGYSGAPLDDDNPSH